MKFDPQLSRRVLCAALTAAVSCTGQIGEVLSLAPATTGGGPRPPKPDPEQEVQQCTTATSRRVRRITLGQYQRTVADLVGPQPGLLAGFARDSSIRGFDNQADALSVSSGNFEEFALAAQLTAEGVDVAALAPCADDEARETCAADFLISFARRAFGRKPSEAEQERLLGLFRAGAEIEGYDRGIRVAIEAVLLSPYFLYRTELGVDGADTAEVALTPDEAANALAFGLTGARPDAALVARAEEDPSFGTPDVLREEAKRLVATPVARQHLARFLRGWLGVSDLRSIHKVPSLFPAFTPRFKADLDQEMNLFLDYVLGEAGGTLQALLGASISFPNGSIFSNVYAKDYDSTSSMPPAPPDESFAETPLNTKLRRGVLSLAGWLSAHAPVHRSSPVDRGLAIRTRFFCQTISSPPPQAVFSAPAQGDDMATTREKFEQHAKDEQCRSCHRFMDPIGFGLEMMDALGRFRVTEAGRPVDSQGELTGTDVDGPFRGPAELADKLLESRQVRDCFVLQMFRYIEGRDERPEDACAIAELQSFFAEPSRTIGDLAVKMVLRPSYMKRRYEP